MKFCGVWPKDGVSRFWLQSGIREFWMSIQDYLPLGWHLHSLGGSSILNKGLTSLIASSYILCFICVIFITIIVLNFFNS